MAMQSSDHEEVMSEINVTPLVDVMLVLLVVFIVTAPLLTNAIRVDLPDTAKTAAPDDADAITVSIDAAGRIFVEEREVGPPTLEAELAALVSADPELALYLQADDAARYGTVAKVMAAIERAGVPRVSVITEAE